MLQVFKTSVDKKKKNYYEAQVEKGVGQLYDASALCPPSLQFSTSQKKKKKKITVLAHSITVHIWRHGHWRSDLRSDNWLAIDFSGHNIYNWFIWKLVEVILNIICLIFWENKNDECCVYRLVLYHPWHLYSGSRLLIQLNWYHHLV